METTRPEASEITGTLREMSGFTVPVTTSSGAAVWDVAVATGNCSGCWTEKTVTSKAGTIVALGGASALVSARAPPQPSSSSSAGTIARRRPIFKTLRIIRDSYPREAGCVQNLTITPALKVTWLWRRSGNQTLPGPPQFVYAAPRSFVPAEAPLEQTYCEGEPLFPPGGVTPPRPVQ